VGEQRWYRIALVVEPYEAESRRLARHPGVVAHTIVAEEVAQVFAVAVRREVPDEHLQGMQGISALNQLDSFFNSPCHLERIDE